MKKTTKILIIVITVIVIAALIVLYFYFSKGKRVVIETFDNGKPAIVYYYKNIDGVKTKVYEEKYYPNNELRSEGKCLNSKRLGVWKFYFDNGDVFAKADFNNHKEGEKWEMWNDKKEQIINLNDKLEAIAFTNEGTPISIKVRRNGTDIYYRFFNSFKMFERRHLKGNLLNGESISWFENGTINSLHYYKNGIQDSSYVVYSENGQKIISGQYAMGKQVGKWEYFQSDGTPAGVDVFDVDGTKLISKDNF